MNRINIILNGNDEMSQDDVIRYGKDYINKYENNLDYYLLILDSATNKLWKIYSDDFVKKYDIKSDYICNNGEAINGVLYIGIADNNKVQMV